MLAFTYLCGLAFVGSMLLATGGAHLAGLADFYRLLRRHGLLPEAFSAPVAALVTSAELAIGLTALTALSGVAPRLSRAAFAAALGVGSAFIVYLRRLLRTRRAGSCGCSPLASPLTPASFMPAASLVSAGALGLLAQWGGAGVPQAPTPWSGLAIVWGFTLAGLVLLLPASAPGNVETKA